MDAVIGASSHLGNALTRELVSRGVEVKPIFRTPPLFEPGVDPFICNTADIDSLTQAFEGIDVVYHTAGLVSIGLRKYRAMYEANVLLTKRVIQACRKAGVRRFVFAATIEAFDLLSGPYPIHEQSTINPDRTVMPYGKTKALAVLEVEQAVQQEHLDAVTVFPTGFIGPFDYKLSPMTKLMLDYATGKIPVGIAGGFDFVDIRDVACGMISAANSDAGLRRYLLPGAYVTVDELFSVLEKVTGRRPPRFQLPAAISPAAGFAAECFYFLMRRQPRYTRKSLKILSLGVTVSGALASQVLGYSPRPLEATVEDTIEWLAAHGYWKQDATR